jgi:hypothetical protein
LTSLQTGPIVGIHNPPTHRSEQEITMPCLTTNVVIAGSILLAMLAFGL